MVGKVRRLVFYEAMVSGAYGLVEIGGEAFNWVRVEPVHSVALGFGGANCTFFYLL
jgi:hypothetical protein